MSAQNRQSNSSLKIVIMWFVGIVLVLLFLAVTFSSFQKNDLEVIAEESILDNDKKLIVLLIPGFSYSDLADFQLENFDRLIDQGAIGLMNAGAADSYHPASAYLTLGTGVRAVGDSKSGLALEKDESHQQVSGKALYYRHQGKQIDRADALLPYINRLQQLNAKVKHPVEVGILGENLAEHNKQIKFWGNSDTDELQRFGALIVANELGKISQASLSRDKILVEDSFHPYGMKTDMEAMELQLSAGVEQDYYLQVFEFGDLLRLDEYEENINSARERNLRKYYYQKLDGFISELNQLIGEYQIILMNPAPSIAEFYEGKRLKPLIITPVSEHDTPILLSSETTKRKGIVSNMDFAPTILQGAGIDVPVQLLGDDMQTVAAESSQQFLQDKYQSVLSTYQKRPVIVQGFIAIKIAIMVVGIVNIYGGNREITGLSTVVLAILASPLFILLLSGCSPVDVVAASLFLILGSALLAVGFRLILSVNEAVGLICLLISGTLLLDLLMGSDLIYGSVLGHDIISGARYYGLGNEFAGILLGSTTLAVFALNDRVRCSFYLYLFVAPVLMLIFAHPNLGANFGGFVSTLLLLVFFVIKFGKRFVAEKNFLKLFGMTSIVIGAVVVIFVLLNTALSTKSHVGKTVELITALGWEELYNIIYRKVSMNLSLIQYSRWSKLLLSFVAVLIVMLFWKPTEAVKQSMHKYHSLYQGIQGNVFGSAVLLLANDSGVVAAATMLIFAVPPLILLNLPPKNST